ncbi:MAG TPA: hypothetical protein VG847_08805 [Chitinophagaceae bacterium]|nr:hypothetical protein [Chitinophagaceae bacterium]
MIGFVVPFRSKASSNNWPLHSRLLHRTIQSICNQPDTRFRVIVVYTDLPENKTEHPNVIYLHFPFHFLKANEIGDYESFATKYYSPKDLENAMDQGRRILFGCKEAKRLGCNYIMSVDADDMVSNKIVGYINKLGESGIPGWYVKKGYVCIENKSIVYRQPDKMNLINGSTYIIHRNIIPDPDFNSDRLTDFNFFSAHGWLRARLSQNNIELLPLPFYAILYSLNSESWTYNSYNFENKGIRKILKRLLRGSFFTAGIFEEFGYYAVC